MQKITFIEYRWSLINSLSIRIRLAWKICLLFNILKSSDYNRLIGKPVNVENMYWLSSHCHHIFGEFWSIDYSRFKMVGRNPMSELDRKESVLFAPTPPSNNSVSRIHSLPGNFLYSKVSSTIRIKRQHS